jgi:hypothetical protein
MNLEKIYEIVTKRNEKINYLYNDLGEYKELFENILKEINLEINEETMHSITQRFVNLREDALLNMMKKANFSNEEIIKAQITVYNYVKEFWLKSHQEMIEEMKEYLTPFYYELFKGIHNVGIVFSDWQIEWTNAIINGINQDLLTEFNGDEAKIFEMLRSKQLFDLGHNGEADRCYTVLVKEDNEYKVKTYPEIFKNEIYLATKHLQELILKLNNYEDEYKKEWINYLNKINDALLCDERDNLRGGSVTCKM